ncbi:hypothetical protein AHF37_11439 [Paragonimus kellicotti]|nr:hypothetical protein AHF37_11439 [Paragonimus kellicotti]
MLSNTSLVSQAPLLLPNWDLHNMHLSHQPATLPASHQSRTSRHSAQAFVPSWTLPNLAVPSVPSPLTPSCTRNHMFYAADTLSLLKANTQESVERTCTSVSHQNESTAQLTCEFQNLKISDSRPPKRARFWNQFHT